MDVAVDARALSKRYRGRWALRDCTLTIPAGHTVGLVGPNGAGKSTLLSLAAGHIRPTAGDLRVLGGHPADSARQTARVGYVAQDAPLYTGLRVADHLTLGARLNRGWDQSFAADRLAQLNLRPTDRVGALSGGQRAQLALTIALAKRPELLLLDEPVASLDPLARREFLDALRQSTAEHATTIVLSSHVVSDLAVICDYLIVLNAAQVVASGPVTDLLTAAATTDLEALVLGHLAHGRTQNPQEQR
jgi:ABC-2 type transport system ATP-binding protein